jgi:hypothetical protein
MAYGFLFYSAFLAKNITIEAGGYGIIKPIL